MGWTGRDERVSDLFFVDPESPGAPTAEGQVRYDNNDLVAFVDGEVKSLTAGASSGISAEEHRVLRQLIHFINEGPAEGFTSGAYKQVVGSKIFPTAIIWWTAPDMQYKIVEKIIVRHGSGTKVKPNPIFWKIYDTDGTTVLWTVMDEIQWSGVFEISRVRTIVQGNLIAMRAEETVTVVDGVSVVQV
jgi:hypothetical protein